MPADANTRWQGINTGTRFLPSAPPTARAARGEPRLSKCGFAGECIRLRRFNPAMRVAQKAIDHNGRDFVLAAKIDAAFIIAQKA